MKTSLFLLSFLLVSSSFSYARELVLNFMNPTKDSPKAAFLYSPDFQIHLDALPRRNFTLPVEIPPGELTLYLVSQLPTDEVPLPIGAPKLIIPEHYGRVAVILLHDQSNSVFPARPAVIDASSEQFQPGSTLICNFTNSAVTGTLGPEKVRIRPKNITYIPMPQVEETTYKVVLDSVLPEQDSLPRPLIRAYWRLYPSHRQFVFITQRTNSTGLQVTSLLDAASLGK